MTQPYVGLSFIGDNFEPGVWEAAEAAAARFADRGGKCKVEVVHNLCYVPHFGLGAMKNFALMRALERGCSHFMLMECDVLITDEDLIWRFAEEGLDVTVPYYDLSVMPNGKPVPIMRPQVEIVGDALRPITWQYPRDGVWTQDAPPENPTLAKGYLLQLEWAVMSCMMFDCRVFAPDRLGERPFTEVPIVKNEEYNCLWWRRRGVTIWQHLNANVKLLRPPTSTEGVSKHLYVGGPLGSPTESWLPK